MYRISSKNTFTIFRSARKYKNGCDCSGKFIQRGLYSHGHVIFICITLFTAWRNRSKLIGFNKKSTAFRSKPSTAYFRNAVVKITFGGFFSVLKKLVPSICGILMSRNKRFHSIILEKRKCFYCVGTFTCQLQ